VKYERTRERGREIDDHGQKSEDILQNTHDLSMPKKKTYCGTCNEVSYLLIQVKNNTGRVRDSHHPLQWYLRSQILENKEAKKRKINGVK